ncbi:MAG: ribonuclease P protein component 4 [Halobacteriota archaeon]
MSQRHKKKEFVKDIVLQRIDRLFEAAFIEFPDNAQRSDRYVELVRKLATKHRVSLGKTYKMHFCRSCGAYFVYGANARVRIKDKRTVVTCLRCRETRRY